MADLLSYAETQKLLEELPREQQKLVDDLIPSQISAGAVQRVLQALLAERISIRDLPTILEGIQEACGGGLRAIPAIAGHVRTRLARQISDSHTGPSGYIPLVTLSPEWEAAFSDSLVGPPEDRHLAIAPTQLNEFMQRFRAVFDGATAGGEAPVLLCSGRSARMCERSSSASGPAPRCSPRTKSTRARGSGPWRRSEPGVNQIETFSH